MRKSSAIRIHRTGGPDSMEFESVEIPQPGRNEVVVRHTAIGVNFIDTYHRSGLYPLSSLPHGLGVEASGIVEEAGPDVPFKAGDRVAYAGGSPGAYAERRVVPADILIPLPSDIDDALAAACLLKGMTAEVLIRRVFDVRAGHKVLLHAAAGGVGLIACQWLRHLQATVIATVGDEEKAELVRAMGGEHVIVYSKEDFRSRVREITSGEGVDVVYDGVGKATFMSSIECLAPRGLMVSFGNASGKPEPFDISILAERGSLFLTRPTLFTYTARRSDLLDCAAAVFEVIRQGAVRIELRQRWALREAPAAHRALEGRRTIGSSVLIPTWAG